jgi:transcriptional regulator with PAS, ATPase and Fis domain
VTVNVAAIPDTLLEVEFFGAAPGAYTGAERRGRVGKFELAHGGTLFLDEIGDMPLPLQGKLLRVLQDQEFEPLGSNRIVRTDVRIVAATSADLPALVAVGRFRADLFYRLNVLTIRAPSLRARRSDIEALAYSILEELSAPGRGGHGRHFELQDDALRLLAAHDWPGNVRELRNTLERAVMLADTERIDARTLAPFIGAAALPAPGLAIEGDGGAAHSRAQAERSDSYTQAMTDFERRFLCDALRATGGRVAEAAARIGMGRATLYKKIAALGIEI